MITTGEGPGAGQTRARPHGTERSHNAAGEEKKRRILEASVQVFGQGGSSAVTHRAVARAAGVPLGSMTYYFSSREDLLRQTMHHAVQVEAARLAAAVQDYTSTPTVDSATDALTVMFFDKTVADPAYDLALFEMFLEATRNPAVRDETRGWSAMIARITDRVLPPTRPDVPRAAAVQIVATSIDGLMLEEVSNAELGLAALRDRLRIVIASLSA